MCMDQELEKRIIELAAKRLSLKNVSDSDKSSRFEEALEGFTAALDMVIELKERLDASQKKTMPKKEELESISTMLDIINKVDFATLDKLNQLGGGVGGRST